MMKSVVKKERSITHRTIIIIIIVIIKVLLFLMLNKHVTLPASSEPNQQKIPTFCTQVCFITQKPFILLFIIANITERYLL